MSVDMNHVVGRCDLLMVTLDSLRYDVATRALAAGGTPVLAAHLPGGQYRRAGGAAAAAPGSATTAAAPVSRCSAKLAPMPPDTARAWELNRY